MAKPKFKELRRCYGFDDIAIVPGDVTINPEQINLDLKIGEVVLTIPIVAAAMDGVTDINTSILMSKLGGLSILHLEGVHTRYNNPEEILAEIVRTPQSQITALLQKIYAEPIKPNLIGECIQTIKKAGAYCGVSVSPANTKKFAPLIVEAKADILVVQSTVTTARHISKSYRGLILHDLCQSVPIPVVIGNCVSYTACLEIMREGVAAMLIGVGPGAACTSRQVLGVGVPQVTATMDCALARDDYFKESGRYIPIITDGGMTNGGDICKAFASGADGIMLGSIFAQAKEAPAAGYHWGMSHPNPALPRGTRIKVGTTGTLQQILFGPTSVTDGSQNLVGALRTAMGFCGAANIQEFHKTEVVVAPSIVTEGKIWQRTQTCA
jgi:IMP dehydrogenase